MADPRELAALAELLKRPQVEGGEYGMPYMPPLPPRDPGSIENIKRPGEYTQPIAEMTGPPLIGPGGNLAKMLMKGAGLGAAGAIVATPSEAGDGSELDPRLAKVKELDQKIAAGSAKLEAMAKVNFQSKQARDNASQPILGEIDAARTLKTQLEGELMAEANRKSAAGKPFRERYPEIAGSMPGIGLGLAAALPFSIATKRNASSFFPSSPEGQVRGAIARNQSARKLGNADQVAITKQELANHVDAAPTLSKELMKAGAAGASGGALAAESSMFPDQYDAFNLPEGKMKNEARDRALSIGNYAERGIIGALTGLSGYEAGSFLTPYRGANMSLAKSLKDADFKPASTPIPGTAVEEATKVVFKGKDKNGRKYYKDEAGLWASPPKKAGE
jgi:hypothetical protein